MRADERGEARHDADHHSDGRKAICRPPRPKVLLSGRIWHLQGGRVILESRPRSPATARFPDEKCSAWAKYLSEFERQMAHVLESSSGRTSFGVVLRDECAPAVHCRSGKPPIRRRRLERRSTYSLYCPAGFPPSLSRPRATWAVAEAAHIAVSEAWVSAVHHEL